MVAATAAPIDEPVTDVVLDDRAVETPKPEFDGAARRAEVESDVARLEASFTAREMSTEVVLPAMAQLEEQRDDLRTLKRRVEAAGSRPNLTIVDRASVVGGIRRSTSSTASPGPLTGLPAHS